MTTTLRLVAGEVQGLGELLGQLIDLFTDADDADPAIERLSPPAYRDNPEASAEFRRLTHTDLLSQRSIDAQVALASLPQLDQDDDRLDEAPDCVVTLNDGEVLSWMRTLAALRLVMATRLGIDQNDHHDHDDPKFALYDWLAYRLETLVEASEN